MKLIVIDANAYWTEEIFRSCGQFADVLLVKPRDFRAHRKATGRWRSDAVARRVGERVWERRLSMPPGWLFGLWPWTGAVLARTARAFAVPEEMVLVLTFPQYRRIVERLRPRGSVYYNYDDYRDNWPRHRSRMPEWERALVARADATVCIAAHRAEVLRASLPDRAARIHHIPIGATPAFMAAEEALGQPTGNMPPVAGYVGALNYRFDFALVAETARLLPDVRFVLGGRVVEDGDGAWQEGLRAAQSRPNITFRGWVEHVRLPEVLGTFDVLLMPYARCHFNTNACPAKLWDYLGTGKPIVANEANPETLRWREHVYLGADAPAFAAAVRAALAESGCTRARARHDVARVHSWERLAERMRSVLQETCSEAFA